MSKFVGINKGDLRFTLVFSPDRCSPPESSNAVFGAIDEIIGAEIDACSNQIGGKCPMKHAGHLGVTGAYVDIGCEGQMTKECRLRKLDRHELGQRIAALSQLEN